MFEQQRIDPGHVVFVAAGQDEAPDAAEFVDDGMELGGAAAARPADRLGMRPRLGAEPPFSAPAAARCALIAVLSIISTLVGRRRANSLNKRCQMPCAAHRLNRL